MTLTLGSYSGGEFKAEMQSQSLYCEFTSTQDFERKWRNTSNKGPRTSRIGELPLPATAIDLARTAATGPANNGDPRLHSPLDFGNDVQAISIAFTREMAKFAAAGAGSDKYRDLAAHVYTSVGAASTATHIHPADAWTAPARNVIKEVSADLKLLAADVDKFKSRAFNTYWVDGEKIGGRGGPCRAPDPSKENLTRWV